MSARRARQELKAGMQEFENMIETMVEKHLSKSNVLPIDINFDHACVHVHLLVDPADLKPRSNLSIALGCLPHLIILTFSVIVVWTAKPSSSKNHIYDTCIHAPLPLCMYHANELFYFLTLGLFSWHPTLMTLAVSFIAYSAVPELLVFV